MSTPEAAMYREQLHATMAERDEAVAELSSWMSMTEEAQNACAALLDQRDALRAQVAAVRALHHGIDYGDMTGCAECLKDEGFGDFGVAPWPCSTSAALDGAE